MFSAVVFAVMEADICNKKDAKAAEKQQIYTAIKAFGLDQIYLLLLGMKQSTVEDFFHLIDNALLCVEIMLQFFTYTLAYTSKLQDSYCSLVMTVGCFFSVLFTILCAVFNKAQVIKVIMLKMDITAPGV